MEIRIKNLETVRNYSTNLTNLCDSNLVIYNPDVDDKITQINDKLDNICNYVDRLSELLMSKGFVTESELMTVISESLLGCEQVVESIKIGE